MSVFTQVPAAVLTGRRENGVAHQRVFKSVDAGTFLRRPQRPRRFVCSPLTLPGHLQFPAFLHPLQLSGIPTVDREQPRAREAPSSDSCNELLKTYACISGISLEVTDDERCKQLIVHLLCLLFFIQDVPFNLYCRSGYDVLKDEAGLILCFSYCQKISMEKPELALC